MKLKNIGLKSLRIKDETFGDYLSSKQGDIDFVDDGNVLRFLEFEEVGESGFSIRINGEKFIGDLGDEVESFLEEHSAFRLDNLMIDVSHNYEARKAYEKTTNAARPTVVAILFNPLNEVLLVSNGFAENWSLPQGGMIDKEGELESAVNALGRELREELAVHGGYTITPVESCVRRMIPFGRDVKVDEFENGTRKEWEWKQYHFYALFVDHDFVFVPDGVEVVEAKFCGFDSGEFESMAEYKQDVVEEVFRVIDRYRDRADSLA